MYLTPSNILQHTYCPRFTYFEHVLRIPQYEDKEVKVLKGREIHQRVSQQNKHYLRKKIGVKQKWLDQYLSNGFIRGVVDEVLLLEDNTYAPLDYKFARWDDRIYLPYKIQMYCYAWLIEENFNGKVTRGFLVYTRSKNKLITLEIHPGDIEMVKSAATEIMDILTNNRFPRATRYKSKCAICTYKNICIK